MSGHTKVPYIFDGKLLSRMMISRMTVDAKSKVLLSLSQTEKLTGCSRVTIDRAKKGVSVDAATLYCLCKWMELPMEMFFTKSKK